MRKLRMAGPLKLQSFEYLHSGSVAATPKWELETAFG
jgi:hypothetical protein